MIEKQNLPTWLITRIWFFANCILSILFVLLVIVNSIIYKESSESLSIYFATIFIGLLLSLPSLIILICLNQVYKKINKHNISIKRYISICILVSNFLYLIFSLIAIEVSFVLFLFYATTTIAGLVSHYYLTKKYIPENEI